jgi:hypothetical protein
VAWATLKVLIEHLWAGEPDAEEMGKELLGYYGWIVEHCRRSTTETTEKIDVNAFWSAICDGVSTRVFGETPGEMRRLFKVVPYESKVMPVTAEQLKKGVEDGRLAWKSYKLYLKPGPVIELIQRWQRSQGRSFGLSQMDLRAQMSTHAYWVTPPDGTIHRQRFAESHAAEGCWCIALDRHPLGLVPCSDLVFEQSLMDENQEGMFKSLANGEWTDPRKGDLFALVELLEKKQQALA